MIAAATLEDVALLTGATLVSERRGDALSVIDAGVLGGAARIMLTKDTTKIIGGAGDLAAVERRADSIRAERGLEGNTPFREKTLRERLAKLTGGVAVVSTSAAPAKWKSTNDATVPTMLPVRSGRRR